MSEFAGSPRSIDNTIKRWTDVPDRGGHFAALEELSFWWMA